MVQCGHLGRFLPADYDRNRSINRDTSFKLRSCVSSAVGCRFEQRNMASREETWSISVFARQVVRSFIPQTLTVNSSVDSEDPLFASIKLHTQLRNRLNGKIVQQDTSPAWRRAKQRLLLYSSWSSFRKLPTVHPSTLENAAGFIDGE